MSVADAPNLQNVVTYQGTGDEKPRIYDTAYDGEQCRLVERRCIKRHPRADVQVWPAEDFMEKYPVE